MRRAAILIALAACGGPRAATQPPGKPADATTAATRDGGVAPDEPPTLARDLPTLARRTAEMMEALGDALAASGDCAALATAAKTVLDEHREVRVAAAEVADRGDGRALDAALETYTDRIAGAATRMQPAITRCGSDAAFAEALTPFDTP
jgi:hypothetical protein